MKLQGISSTFVACIFIGSALLRAAEDAEALAKKLSNPIASLISVPFQNNFDWGGDNQSFRYQLNFQPVVPLSISVDTNLIVRTIVPFVSQRDVIPGTSQSGLGDITQSFFFSPKNPTSGGWIWGAGPVLHYPSATDDLLGAGKFGVGPTVVVLKQEGPWTYGTLLNHIWSVAGSGSRQDESASFIQPFISYTTKQATSFTLNTEASYDWERRQWTTPVNLMVAQVFKIGSQPMSAQIGGRYIPAGPSALPDWGFRFALTFLFPK